MSEEAGLISALERFVKLIGARRALYEDDELWGAFTQGVAALVAQVGRNPEGQDPKGLGAEHEHAVGEADAPKDYRSGEEN